MRTWKRTLVMLTAAALTAGASAGTRTWDFSLNASLKEWTLTEWNDVEWKVRSARLFMTDKAPGYAIVGDTDWEDYVVEAKFAAKQKTSVSASFSASSMNRRASFNITPSSCLS